MTNVVPFISRGTKDAQKAAQIEIGRDIAGLTKRFALLVISGHVKGCTDCELRNHCPTFAGVQQAYADENYSSASFGEAEVCAATRRSQQSTAEQSLYERVSRVGSALTFQPPAPVSDDPEERRTAFHAAWVTTEYWRAQLKAASTAWTYARWVLRDSAKEREARNDEHRLEAEWKNALGRQLLTPVTRAADVAWKRKHLDMDLPISRAQIEAAITADEKYLADRRNQRGAEGAIQ